METYDKGDLVRCPASFKVDDVFTDPSTVLFKVKAPDGTITTHTFLEGTTIVQDETGVFHGNISANQVGVWTYRWEGTGVAQGADEQQFRVKKSEFP